MIFSHFSGLASQVPTAEAHVTFLSMFILKCCGHLKKKEEVYPLRVKILCVETGEFGCHGCAVFQDCLGKMLTFGCELLFRYYDFPWKIPNVLFLLMCPLFSKLRIVFPGEAEEALDSLRSHHRQVFSSFHWSSIISKCITIHNRLEYYWLAIHSKIVWFV